VEPIFGDCAALDTQEAIGAYFLNLVIAAGVKYADLIAQEEPEAVEPLKPHDLSWE
jgi:hypothetical protein